MADTTVTAKFEADTRDIVTKMRDLVNIFEDTQKEVQQTSAIYQDAAGKWRNASGQFASASEKAAAGITDMSSQAKKSSSGMGGALKGIGIAAGVLAGGFAIAGKGLLDFGKFAQESVSITRSTEAIIKSTGGTALVTAEEVGKLAQAISEKTGIDDEQIQAGQNMLLTFKNVKNAGEGQAAMFDRASMAAADLSAAGFGSIESASKMLGKALNDPTKGITALGRAGVTFTDQQKDAIEAMIQTGDVLGAQQAIMAEVESQVGGVAEAAASPFDKLNVMIDNFKENVGMAVLPALSSIVEAIGPILNELAGPLGEIAGELGRLLTEVFTQIQPLLAPLITALVEIVSVLAGGFMAAVQALIPAVVPLVSIIAELATQVAPILAPILAEIGEVLGRVLDAVMPLIGPLADLVLNIFDQAAPIIDLAADVLLTLVDSLTPVIAAVSQLIPPLNQIITVLFAAIMPILQPLLPIIQLLADLLGTILVKAISVLMMYIGTMIKAWSKVAPFILRNVVQPVSEFFMDMVDTILQGADVMLGWVPGLGDQLDTAVAAFGELKQGVSDGIESAATTVETEGWKIGENLVTQGLGMFTDPNAPQAAGSVFGSNIAIGMSNAQQDVYEAGVKLREAALVGIGPGLNEFLADYFDIDLGPTAITNPEEYAVSGVGASAGGGGKDKKELTAAERAVMNMKSWAAVVKRYGPDIAKSLQSTDKDLRDAAQGVADSIDAVNDARINVKTATTIAERAQAERDLAEALRERRDAYKDLAEAEQNLGKPSRDAVEAAAEAGRRALDLFKQKAKDALSVFRQVRDAAIQYAGINTLAAPEGARPSAGAYLANMRDRLARIREFGKALGQLRGMGLDEMVYADIVAAGPDAGLQIARALVDAGQGAINDISATAASIRGAAKNVGAEAMLGQTGMSYERAENIIESQVVVNMAERSVVVEVGANTSAADRIAITTAVDTAVRRVLAQAGREADRR